MRTNRQHRQRGATLVEAGVTATTLFMLLLAIVEFGRAYNVYQNVTNAAREGARYAVAPLAGTTTLPSSDLVQARVTTFLESNNLHVPPATITVDGTPTQTINGESVAFTQVTVSAPYSFFFLKFSSMTITATSEMRNETN